MMYRATLKQTIVTNNEIIKPDGFGTWEVINYGTNSVVVNDAITLSAGERFKLELMPNVIFDSLIQIKFEPTANGTSKVAVLKLYNQPV